MADLIIPESYLFCSILLFKLKNKLQHLSKYQIIKRTLLQSRIDDIEYSREVMAEMQFARGDKLYGTIASDNTIAHHAFINELITKEEWQLAVGKNPPANFRT